MCSNGVRKVSARSFRENDKKGLQMSYIYDHEEESRAHQVGAVILSLQPMVRVLKHPAKACTGRALVIQLWSSILPALSCPLLLELRSQELLNCCCIASNLPNEDILTGCTSDLGGHERNSGSRRVERTHRQLHS